MRLSRIRRLLGGLNLFPDVPKWYIRPHSILTDPDAAEKIRWPAFSALVPKQSISLRKLLGLAFDFEAKYPEPMKNIPTLEKGMVLDTDSVHSMFPGDIRLRIRDSRYVVVCCFYLPEPWNGQAAEVIPDLISVTSELRTKYGSDFEMVLVAKMRKVWAKHRPTFNRFFSCFPSFCNVVPLSKFKARDRICKYVGLDTLAPQYLLLERVFQSTWVYRVLQRGCIDEFDRYGANFFPFTDKSIENWKWASSHCQRLNTSSKLDELLGCKPSELQVYKVPVCSEGGGGGGSSMLLSELQGKVMGMYLCSDGSLLEELVKVCKLYTERGFQFEVVVVYVPFNHGVCMQEFMEIVNDKLYKWDARWWALPFKDSVSRWVSQMCPDIYDNPCPDDKMIVFGPHGEYVDPFAGEMLTRYGIDPLTRKRLTEMEVEKFRSLTLESLLVYGGRDYVLGKDMKNGAIQRVPVTQLQGKIILFLFSAPRFFESLLDYYERIKSAHSDFEAVCVPNSIDADSRALSDLPFLFCPFDHDHAAFVANVVGSYKRTVTSCRVNRRVCSYDPEDLRMFDYVDTLSCGALIAFGKDGRVSSYDAESLIWYKGIDAFPFNSDICQDIINLRGILMDEDMRIKRVR